MISQNEIVNFCIAEYLFLSKVYGFKRPRIKKGGWITQLDYLKTEIAVEIILDFRDFVVELFIIRLENGKLYKGYDTSEERRSRIHLLDIVDNKNWAVDGTSLDKLKAKTNRVDRGDFTYFKEELENYRIVLNSCIDKILEQNTNLFD